MKPKQLMNTTNISKTKPNKSKAQSLVQVAFYIGTGNRSGLF